LNGTFEAKGKAFPFHGTWRDGGLDLTCDGRDYRLVVHDSSVAALSEPAAAGVAAVGSDSFVGRFVGTLNGSRATLTLEASADGVAGTARDANAYRYSVRGTYAGDRVHGEWTDPGLGKSLPFELEASADGVVLTFASEPPVSLPFRRSDDAGPAPSTTLDPALLGTWIRNADDERRITLELRADGTYTYGHSRSASPGSAVTGSTATGQLIAGRWRSGEGALLTSVRGQSEFAHFAAYELAQERLVLIFEGTGAEVWRRP
jgi:hypothetical protein